MIAPTNFITYRPSRRISSSAPATAAGPSGDVKVEFLGTRFDNIEKAIEDHHKVIEDGKKQMQGFKTRTQSIPR
jgi:hypothetical protein